MLKNELRLNFLQLRQNLSDNTCQTASKAIAERVFHLPVGGKNRFHLFLPIKAKKEIDTAYLQAELRVPVLRKQRQNFVRQQRVDKAVELRRANGGEDDLDHRPVGFETFEVEWGAAPGRAGRGGVAPARAVLASRPDRRTVVCNRTF